MNTPINVSASAIEVVDASRRLEVLPRHFGRLMMVVESAVYFWASNLNVSYRGGFWRFYEFGEGGFYMAPEGEQFLVQVESNGYEGELSADAFGIVCCLFAFSHLSFEVSDESLARHYHLLRDFALDHREAGKISAAID